MRNLTEDEQEQIQEAESIRDQWILGIAFVVLLGIIIFSIYVFNEN